MIFRFDEHKHGPTPKSLINWILSGVEGCKHLIIRTLRLRSVSGFPLIAFSEQTQTWNIIKELKETQRYDIVNINLNLNH